VISAIEYLADNNIKVYAKSFTHKYTKEILTQTVQAIGVKDLLNQLMPDVIIDYSKLLDIPFLFDYEIIEKTVDEVIVGLATITDFDYYFYRGILYFEDKKTIQNSSVEVASFNEVEHILEISSNINTDAIKINKLYINEVNVENIVSEPKMLLDIRDTPQPCSPDSVLVFTDEDENKYRINPVNASFILYYSPLNVVPELNYTHEHGDRILIEEFSLSDDSFVTLSGGIKETIAVSGVSNYDFTEGFNVLTFDKIAEATLKITYKTEVLHGVFPHSKTEKSIRVLATHYNQQIDYTHKIEFNGYYSIPHTLVFSLVKDWGIDYGDAINKSVTINGVPKMSNSFGELEVEITAYDKYTFETPNQENLYLDYYINKKEFYMDEFNE